MALAESLAVFPYNSLAGGGLTGEYLQNNRASGRLLTNPSYRLRYENASKEPAGQFIRFAETRDFHPASLAISWRAAHPTVAAPILVARNVEQLSQPWGHWRF